jgi:cbb3-type cytochrome oxidase maturation protein
MSGILVYLFLLTLVFLLLLGAGVFWAVRSGQFEDMEGPANRILLDDDDPLLPHRMPEGGLGGDRAE